MLGKKIFKMQQKLIEKDSVIGSLREDAKSLKKDKREGSQAFEQAEATWKKKYRLEKEICDEKIQNYQDQMNVQRRELEHRAQELETKHIRQLELVEERVKRALAKKD